MSQEIRELEREIEESRARLDLTIDQLQGKLTMSGLVNDALGMMRTPEGTGLYDRALNVVRANPLPVLFVAAGIGLFLSRYRKGPIFRASDPESLMEEANDEVFLDADVLAPAPHLENIDDTPRSGFRA